MKIFQVLEVWIICFVRVGLAQGELGCSLSSQQKPGLEANFYSYPHRPANIPREPKSWFLTGIKDTDHLGTQYNVTQPNFRDNSSPIESTIGQIYGFNVTIAHFALELTGYYRASVTGNYTFQLKDTDDGCSFQLGLAPNTACCSQDFDSIVNQDEMLIQHNSDPKYVNRTAYLVEGHYYPVRIAYYNHRRYLVLQLLIQKPGESAPSGDFSGDFFSPECVRDSPPSSSLSSEVSSKPHYSIPSSSKASSVSFTRTSQTCSVTKTQLPSSSSSSYLRSFPLSSTSKRESSETISSKGSLASSQSETSHSIYSKSIQSSRSLVSSTLIESYFLSSSASTTRHSGYSTGTPESSIAQSSRFSHSERTTQSTHLSFSFNSSHVVFSSKTAELSKDSRHSSSSGFNNSDLGPSHTTFSLMSSESQSIARPNKTSLTTSLTGPTSSKATMGSTGSQSIPVHNKGARNAVDRFTVGLVTFVGFLMPYFPF